MDSVVTKDVPPLALVGGNPARIIRYRDKDKYEELKKNKKFFLKLEKPRAHKFIKISEDKNGKE